jgi:hypothetical protein
MNEEQRLTIFEMALTNNEVQTSTWSWIVSYSVLLSDVPYDGRDRLNIDTIGWKNQLEYRRDQGFLGVRSCGHDGLLVASGADMLLMLNITMSGQ